MSVAQRCLIPFNPASLSIYPAPIMHLRSLVHSGNGALQLDCQHGVISIHILSCCFAQMRARTLFLSLFLIPSHYVGASSYTRNMIQGLYLHIFLCGLTICHSSFSYLLSCFWPSLVFIAVQPEVCARACACQFV